MALIVSSIYIDVCGIRRIAGTFGVSIASIRDDLLVIKGHIHALEGLAYTSLEGEFSRYDGLIE